MTIKPTIELGKLILSKTKLVMELIKHRGIVKLFGNLNNEMLMGTYIRKR